MTDIGSWKLIIYPVIIIIVFGGLLSITTKPLIDNGLEVNKNSLGILNNLHDLAMGNLPTNSTTSLFWSIISPVPKTIYDFIVPDSIKVYIAADITALSYMPNEVLIPITIVLVLSLLIGIFNLIKP